MNIAPAEANATTPSISRARRLKAFRKPSAAAVLNMRTRTSARIDSPGAQLSRATPHSLMACRTVRRLATQTGSAAAVIGAEIATAALAVAMN
jgi:hypothetical protein